MTNDQLNAAIAAEIFGWREMVWEFTIGRWNRGQHAGCLSAATAVLVQRVGELGLKVDADPNDGRSYCKAVLKAFRERTP